MIVKLYTTSGCHLCEEALTMLDTLRKDNPSFNINIEEVEIANCDRLVETYGIRIPVIAVEDQEIGWPFSPLELQAFAAHCFQQEKPGT
ncbi:MAG: glutaredoxin family protein [Gammaproteobacteria bacterium]|nr:glutaredoxin family protein [Gammaproteobacteria bacterium]